MLPNTSKHTLVAKSPYTDKQLAWDDFSLKFGEISPTKKNNQDFQAVSTNKKETLNEQKFVPFLPTMENKDTISDAKPECFDINKLEQQQQAITNNPNAIQPFQLPAEKGAQIEKEIQESIQTTKFTSQFIYFWRTSILL